MFKGATMRHLGYLRRTVGLPEAQRVRYRRFAEANAESCWWHARESTTRHLRVGAPVSDELFGNDWRGPWSEAVSSQGDPVASSQIAALSLFTSLLPDDGSSGGGGGGHPGGGGAPPGSGAKTTMTKVWEALGLSSNVGIGVVAMSCLQALLSWPDGDRPRAGAVHRSTRT